MGQAAVVVGMVDAVFLCCCGQKKAALALRVQVRLLGKAIMGGRLPCWGTNNKGSWHEQKCLKPFYYIQKTRNALLPGEELQDSSQSGWPLPFNLNVPKWARGFVFVLLHCLPPTHLCFPLRCLWLLLMLLSPVLASLLGKLCGLPPFLAPFPTSLMVQESFWLFLCLHFIL